MKHTYHKFHRAKSDIFKLLSLSIKPIHKPKISYKTENVLHFYLKNHLNNELIINMVAIHFKSFSCNVLSSLRKTKRSQLEQRNKDVKRYTVLKQFVDYSINRKISTTTLIIIQLFKSFIEQRCCIEYLQVWKCWPEFETQFNFFYFFPTLLH